MTSPTAKLQAGALATNAVTYPDQNAFGPSSTQNTLAAQMSSNPFAMMNFLGEGLAQQNYQNQYLGQLGATRNLQAGQMAAERAHDKYKTDVSAMDKFARYLGPNAAMALYGLNPNEFTDMEQTNMGHTSDAKAAQEILAVSKAGEDAGVGMLPPIGQLGQVGYGVRGVVTPLDVRVSGIKNAPELSTTKYTGNVKTVLKEKVLPEGAMSGTTGADAQAQVHASESVSGFIDTLKAAAPATAKWMRQPAVKSRLDSLTEQFGGLPLTQGQSFNMENHGDQMGITLYFPNPGNVQEVIPITVYADGTYMQVGDDE